MTAGRGGRIRRAPLLLLIALTAIVGLRLARDGPDQGAATARVAEAHARREGPAPCAARPGSGEVWLVVTCGREAARRVYRVGPGGRILDPAPGGT